MTRRSRLRGLGVLTIVIAGAAVAGCGARAKLSGLAARQPTAPVSACARVHPGVGPAAYEAPGPNDKAARVRQGSQVVLAEQGATTLAYVADEDDQTIHVVDLGSMLELTTFDAGGVPGQMMMSADGRLLVTLRDKAQLKVFEPTGSAAGTVAARCSVDTAVEPVGLAMSPDDRTVLVTSGWGHAIAALDSSDMHTKFAAELPREPRSVVVSDDGKKAYVAHAVGGAMSVVDLETNEHKVRAVTLQGKDETPRPKRPPMQQMLAKGAKPMIPVPDLGSVKQERTSCQGFALAKTTEPEGRILAPQVLVESGDTEERSAGYGSTNGLPSEMPDVAVIDEDSEQPMATSLLARNVRNLAGRAVLRECLLPRAAAIDPKRGSLLVTCVGSDTLVEYDAASTEPHHAELRRWRVASGPIGVAVDWAAGRALVWSQYDRTLNVVTLGRDANEQATAVDKPVVRVAVSRHPALPETADVALGRKLFHAAGDPRIASDGRACASCHPDGRDDTITWATPDGPRQTPVLAGRLAGTAPYAWNGSGEDVKHHLSHTFQRLRGGGLAEHELDSLVAYITTMAPPPVVTAAATERARVERGSQIFHSAEAACSSCHGKSGIAPDGLKHDVESRAASDAQGEFDTPSLRFVGGSGPYFHDGRYTSLRKLLVESDGKMGKISHLAPADLDALESYVRTL
jgi:hypothetical protein